MFKPERIAFKEWSLVCEALGNGDQSIILRKGGIHEGAGGFSFQHDRFWLFPTAFHEQAELFRYDSMNSESSQQADAPAEDESQGPVQFRFAAELVSTIQLVDWPQVEVLSEFHHWEPRVLKERFEYEEDRCLWLAIVRVYRAESTWEVPFHPKFRGCRSWVPVPEEPAVPTGFTPVISDAEFGELTEKISTVISQAS